MHIKLTLIISLQTTGSLVDSSNTLQFATRTAQVSTVLFSFSFNRLTNWVALISGLQFNLRIDGTVADSSPFVSDVIENSK